MLPDETMPANMSLSLDTSEVRSEACKSRKPLMMGVVLLLTVALCTLAAVGSEHGSYHMETANNMVRGWSCPPGAYPSGPKQQGAYLCLTCPAGYKCLGGHHPKQRCSRGTGQITRGQSTCKRACGIAIASFSLSCCEGSSSYMLTKQRGVSGNLVHGPVVFDGRHESFLRHSENTFPRRDGSLSVIVTMQLSSRAPNHWFAVVNKVRSLSSRPWGFWVLPKSNGKNMVLLLQRYGTKQIHTYGNINLSSRSSIFTIGFSCDVVKNKSFLYANGKIVGRGVCPTLNSNSLRVGVGGRSRVGSILRGTIFKLSMFNKALPSSQMKALMSGVSRPSCQ